MPKWIFSLEVWQNSEVHHVQPGQMMGTYVKKTEFLIFTSLLTGCSCCWWRCCTEASSCTCCAAVRKVQLLWVIKGIFFSIKIPTWNPGDLISPSQSLFTELVLWMCFSLGPSCPGQCFRTQNRDSNLLASVALPISFKGTLLTCNSLLKLCFLPPFQR